MRKDSVLIFGVSAVITAAVVGGVYYMAVARHGTEAPAFRPSTSETIKPDQSLATGNPRASAETSNRRTSTAIRCHDPKRGEFWTNAATCQEADLNNRLSYAQSRTTPKTAEERYRNERYLTPQQEADRNRSRPQTRTQPVPEKPTLRLNAKAPPSNLSANCKFPVGKALELERVLSAADEPWKSKWRPDYCEWLGEVGKKRCEVPTDLFYYKTLCPPR